ncbi:MAG: hypothetical protein H0Z34_08795 [Brevibacillus sp.]|nr:hypothetical protein [Brevibacillus sp.]
MSYGQENRFPHAMRDTGTPEEMSPTDAITDSYNDVPPVVEVSRPIVPGEPLEVREPLALGDVREERLEK